MGETSSISWTDATFNPWIGCTKVSQGCKLCYAETQNNRYQWNPAGWGPGATRKRTSAANWKKPNEWAKKARAEGVTRRVFCASLADVFDAEVDQSWRADLFGMIDDINARHGGLEWLILTKRPENIDLMLPERWKRDRPDYVRIGVTVEHQETMMRMAYLLAAWKGKNFVSYEPALGPLFLGAFRNSVDWLICGGESGAGCRSFDIEWARSIRDECKQSNIPFFMKQLGGHPDKRHDPAEWPEDLRVQEFPV